jgi:branched-subunit amino acid transport protein
LNEWVMIGGMALVTFLLRYLPLSLVGKLKLPDNVLLALRYVPPAILAAIILPEMLIRDEQLSLGLVNTRLYAGIIAGLVAWRTRSLLLTIVVGMAALWLLGAIVPSG